MRQLLNQLKKDNLSEADNRKHREQVELINELKQNESKHAETINRLEKVILHIHGPWTVRSGFSKI